MEKVTSQVSPPADPQIKYKIRQLARSRYYEDRVVDFSPGLLLDTEISDAHQLELCKKALRSWEKLPEEITLESNEFSSGTQSVVRRVSLIGPGAEHIDPKACVYCFSPVEDIYGQQVPEALQANEKFIIAAGEAGVAPKVYMAEAKHRVIEFCDGKELFGGEDTHFIYRLLGPRATLPDNSPSDLSLMEAAGKAIGAIHAVPLDWLSTVVSIDEFDKRMASPMMFPSYVSHFPHPIVERVRSSVVLPTTGLFAQPCSCHMDLHGGNMILTENRRIKVIDWETVVLGHRGQDLSYFFMNSPGSTYESRCAFACAYLVATGSACGEEDIHEFLWDVERSMPLGLVAMVCLTQFSEPGDTEQVVGLLSRTLDFLEDIITKDSLKENDEVLQKGVVDMMWAHKPLKHIDYRPFWFPIRPFKTLV